MINIILFFALAACGLFAIGLYEEWTRPKAHRDLEDVMDGEDLFCGWDWLPPIERKQRLALY